MKINIKGTNYKLKIISDTQKINILENDTEWCGLCDHDNKIIYLDSNPTSSEEFLVTFFHEYLHALLHELSIADDLEGGVEQLLVDNIAKEITKFVDPNNKTVKYIKNKSKKLERK